MARVAFKMKLNEGFEEEYKKRHDELWPDLEALLKESGISDYSIFLDKETNAPSVVYRRSGWTYGVITLDSTCEPGEEAVEEKIHAYRSDDQAATAK